MNIQQSLIENTIQFVSVRYNTALGSDQVTLQETRKEFEGQLTIVVFSLTRFSRKSPEQTGLELGEYLTNELEDVADFNVIKGFLNLRLTDDYWFRRFQGAI